MNVTEWRQFRALVIEWTIYYRGYPGFNQCHKSTYCLRPNAHLGYCFPDPPSEGSP